jgi:hypothetical protein
MRADQILRDMLMLKIQYDRSRSDKLDLSFASLLQVSMQLV